MQQMQALFGGGRNAEPDSSILAEWNKCAAPGATAQGQR